MTMTEPSAPSAVRDLQHDLRHARSWVDAARNCLLAGDVAGALRCINNILENA